MAKYIAYVPQSSSIAFDFSVFDIVLMGRFHSSKLHINYSNNDKKIALEALEKIGILEFKDRAYANLSGGERQLVLIARAICQQSKMVIMDEPVTGLDLGNQIKLLKTIKNIQKDGGTIIQTTHYPDHALLISNSVLWIANGEIFACGEPTKIITPQRIKDVYGINSEFFTDKFGKSHIILSNNFKD